MQVILLIKNLRHMLIMIEGSCFDLITDTYESCDEFDIYDSCATLIDVVTNAASVSKTMISVDKIVVNGIQLS
jgi:chaperonin GroEL (HSP60 family)